MLTKFERFCTPAKIYFALAILSIILGLFSKINIFAILGKLIFAFIFTFILNWLCSKGFKALSWFLVLLPYVIILLGMLGIMRMSRTMPMGMPMSIPTGMGTGASMGMPMNMPSNSQSMHGNMM